MTGRERSGSGTPTVLAPGVGGNGLCSKPLLVALAERRVIPLDMPGHGRSTGTRDWEMEPLADFVFSLSRHLVKRPAIWGGHPWGGKLAPLIAATHPEAPHALLLPDPSPASAIPLPAHLFVDI